MPCTSPSPIWKGSAWQPPTGICPGLRGVSTWPSPSFGPERGDRPLLEPDWIGRASLLAALQRPFVDLDRGQLLQLSGPSCPGGDRRERLRRLLLDDRALEEGGIHLPPEPHGVGEHEVTEVVGGEQAVLDQLVRLGDDLAHVGGIEVADV